MEMDDAVGTITQALSVLDRTPVPYEPVRAAQERALNRKSVLVGIRGQAALSCERLAPPTAQNFRIILRSSRIVKERGAL